MNNLNSTGKGTTREAPKQVYKFAVNKKDKMNIAIQMDFSQLKYTRDVEEYILKYFLLYSVSKNPKEYSKVGINSLESSILSTGLSACFGGLLGKNNKDTIDNVLKSLDVFRSTYYNDIYNIYKEHNKNSKLPGTILMRAIASNKKLDKLKEKVYGEYQKFSEINDGRYVALHPYLINNNWRAIHPEDKLLVGDDVAKKIDDDDIFLNDLNDRQSSSEVKDINKLKANILEREKQEYKTFKEMIDYKMRTLSDMNDLVNKNTKLSEKERTGLLFNIFQKDKTINLNNFIDSVIRMVVNVYDKSGFYDIVDYLKTEGFITELLTAREKFDKKMKLVTDNDFDAEVIENNLNYFDISDDEKDDFNVNYELKRSTKIDNIKIEDEKFSEENITKNIKMLGKKLEALRKFKDKKYPGSKKEIIDSDKDSTDSSSGEIIEDDEDNKYEGLDDEIKEKPKEPMKHDIIDNNPLLTCNKLDMLLNDHIKQMSDNNDGSGKRPSFMSKF